MNTCSDLLNGDAEEPSAGLERSLPTESLVLHTRYGFHRALIETVLVKDRGGIPSIADKASKPSIDIARQILDRLGSSAERERLAGQEAGRRFEEACRNYLAEIWPYLGNLRPGRWSISKGSGSIAQYDQYEHLAALDDAAKNSPELAAALGADYLIKPDVVIVRYPEDDIAINAREPLLNGRQAANHTPLRRANSEVPILHASISCKWTIRSDRAQNARSEGLNLVRNRKGRLPHIAVVTAEPMPNRIASIALGTGDIDCVYHIALPELRASVQDLDLDDAAESLETMIGGKRLRDISDLPFDLTI